MTRHRKIVVSVLVVGVLAGGMAGIVSPSPPHVGEAHQDVLPPRVDVDIQLNDTVLIDEEVRFRPVFARSRRSVASLTDVDNLAPAPKTLPPSPKGIVTGVLMEGGRKAVLLRREGVARAEVVNEGDMLGEWRLANITIDGAEWVHSNERVALSFPPRLTQSRGGGRR